MRRPSPTSLTLQRRTDKGLTAEPAGRRLRGGGGSGGRGDFRLAVARQGTDGADFSDIVCFDKLAATLRRVAHKGREVTVVGTLRLNERTGRDSPWTVSLSLAVARRRVFRARQEGSVRASSACPSRRAASGGWSR